MKKSSDPASMSILSVLVQNSVQALKECEQQGVHLTRLLKELESFDTAIFRPGEEHPSKQKRKHRNYLSLLQERELENIIRYLSDRPQSFEWEAFIDASNVESLYCCKGSLGSVFRKMFRKVEILLDPADKKNTVSKLPDFPSTPKQFPHLSCRLPVKTIRMPLRCRTSNFDLQDVLKVSGSSMDTLRFTGARQSVYPPHMISWIGPFAKYCTSVKHLEMISVSVEVFEMILIARAGQLETLRLSVSCSSPAHLHCVSKYCSGLSTLSLALYQHIHNSLWVTLGPTRQELHITLPKQTKTCSSSSPSQSSPAQIQATVKCIEENCRAIRRISINPMPVYIRNEVESLFRSYGGQLEYARTQFCMLTPVACRNIAASCPNAVFDIMRWARGSVVLELNFQISRLTFRSSTRLFDMSVIGSTCKKVRKISFLEQNWEDITTVATILQEPKPLLTKLVLELKEDTMSRVLVDVAKYTTTLRYIRISMKIMRCTGFRELFEANPRLERVKLVNWPSDTTSCINAVVEILRQCTSLRGFRELIVAYPSQNTKGSLLFRYEDLARIADACVPLRSRRVHIRIFEVNYL